MTEALIIEWLDRFADQVNSQNPTEQSAEKIKVNLRSRIAALNKIADTVYQRWINTFDNNKVKA